MALRSLSSRFCPTLDIVARWMKLVKYPTTALTARRIAAMRRPSASRWATTLSMARSISQGAATTVPEKMNMAATDTMTLPLSGLTKAIIRNTSRLVVLTGAFRRLGRGAHPSMDCSAAAPHSARPRPSDPSPAHVPSARSSSISS